MTPPVLVALALLVAATGRAPRRVRGLVPDPVATRAVGGLVRRIVPVSVAPDREPLLGRLALTVTPLLLVDPRVAVGAGVAVHGIDVMARRRRAQDLGAAISRELPEVIELIGLALAGGGSIHHAVGAVATTPIGPVSEGMAGASRAIADGARLGDALDRLVDDLGPAVRPLVRVLTGAEHYGTSIEQALVRLAAEARATRRRDAETRARRVPVRLLAPLVLCVLPAFVLLTVVPTVARTFDGLRFSGAG